MVASAFSRKESTCLKFTAFASVEDERGKHLLSILFTCTFWATFDRPNCKITSPALGTFQPSFHRNFLDTQRVSKEVSVTLVSE